MEAVPRLPMIHFELKISPDHVQFGPQLKQYIASFYNEDPESYNTEIHNLEALRAVAVRPTIDVAGCQLLKKYYCQLHFLKSRFPMAELQAAAVYFPWKDTCSSMSCSVPDIRFEIMCVLHNMGALHSQLGALDGRTSPDGMKMACTHFQCAAWAFQTIKESYHQMVPYISSIQIFHYMQQICLAQAQECILEKSMMDNRKATIIAKVAVQVVDYYRASLSVLQITGEESSFTDLVGSKTYKEWIKYLNFKISYHKCVALLFQGQQAEEQQKMGERVAFYQSACEQLEEARKLASSLKQQKEVGEAIAFTTDVVEGKRKAAKNENEFIYHEEVPDKHALQEVKGASLVKGIPFNINDGEVSGPDIFSRLVPMEAHEASSLYSEKKAQMLRQIGELVENKDQALVEFLSSMQLDAFTSMRKATGIPQDLVDRAAALSARPTVTQELIESMGKLSNSYHEVESMLNEVQGLVKEEEQNEKEYQELMGKRPTSIIATDLSREAAKYREAHNKANDSNQNLHKAMTTHVANLKILSQPLRDLQKQLPALEFPNPNVDDNAVKEIDMLMGKVDEMRAQRAMLWGQLRESVHKDDITNVLVTKPADQALDQVFQQELKKHQELASLIEQNTAAQENILQAFVEAYARATPSRRYVQEIMHKRNTTITALLASFDTYEDLLAKANKGIEFYGKLETNVSKLLQRIKSASKVQQEEREQFLLKNTAKHVTPAAPVEESPVVPTNTAPKLRDYLESRKKTSRNSSEAPQFYPDAPMWPPGVRPAPLGSEISNEAAVIQMKDQERSYDSAAYLYQQYQQPKSYYDESLDKNLADRMQSAKIDYYAQYGAFYPSTGYNYYQQPMSPGCSQAGSNITTDTATTNTYQPISSVQQAQQYMSGSNDANNYAGYAGYSYPTQSAPQNTPTNMNYPTTPQKNATNYPTTPTNSGSYPTNFENYSTTSAYQPGPTNLENYTPSPVPYSPSSNIYYPPGYPTNAYPPQYSQYPTAYSSSSEYATSISNSVQHYNSTYSSPNVDLKSSQSSLNNYAISNGQSYQTIESEQQYPPYDYYAQNQNYNYYPSPSPQVVDTGVPTKESNVDLLTGLDFTVNQAPLIPQQNVDQKKPSVEVLYVNKVAQKQEPVVVEKEIVVEAEKINRKPLNHAEVKRLFEQEVDKFQKFVDVLGNKTLNGPTNLDLKWKEIQDKQDAEKKVISVARCYPMKNRCPDILPYDYSRVELKTGKDDYINASFVKNISYYSAPLIVTQAPLSATFLDFWSMIREQQVELLVCLLGDSEIGNEVYWPTEKGKDLSLGNLVVSLVSTTVKPQWTERVININLPEKRDSRTILHLQFTAWPGSLFPTSPDFFVTFTSEVINLYMQQRSTSHPIAIHCSSGIGRSGLLCLLISAILEVTNNYVSVPDLVTLSCKLSASRKNILRDREHLKFAYEAFLNYMEQVISQGKAKRILNEVVKVEKQDLEGLLVSKTEIKPELDNDPLSSLDPFWASKK